HLVVLELCDTLSAFLSYGRGLCLIFFFQAEDGIRDDLVTGVQTCALPISHRPEGTALAGRCARAGCPAVPGRARDAEHHRSRDRSEERRVGKECRSRWAP